MTEQEALERMVAPGTRRPGKPLGGVVQLLVTSSCNLSCFSCTQASNLRRKAWFMTPGQLEQAVLSLAGYFGAVGVFGGCPTISPHFEAYCEILRRHVPKDRCGLWANNLMGKGAVCRATFSTAISNLNVHLDRAAFEEMRRDWPEARPFGLDQDSRHSPPYVAMRDVLRKECSDSTGWHRAEAAGAVHCFPCPECGGTGQVYDEAEAWRLISSCDINQHWSALVGVFRGELRAWFCEIAGAQAVLHQDEISYPDTGLDPTKDYYMPTDAEPGVSSARPVRWWQLRMPYFAGQVRKHCHDCGIPLRGRGELALAPDGAEQVSRAHEAAYQPKRKGRRVELVTVREQLGEPLGNVVRYLQNAKG